MTRARDLLRQRLVRRGFATDGAAVTAALARQPVPLTLIDSTVRASLGFATKQATAAGLASATATALARGVLHTMMISKFKVLGVAALAGVMAVGGARSLARQFGAAERGPQPATDAPKSNDQPTDLLRSVDKIDDLLDDVERRNRDLQTELRALRKEIVALRSAESKEFYTRARVTTPQRKGIDVEAPTARKQEQPRRKGSLKRRRGRVRKRCQPDRLVEGQFISGTTNSL